MSDDAYAPIASGYRTLAALIERSERARARAADQAAALEAALKAIAALNDSHVIALATEDFLGSLPAAPDLDAPGVANVLFRRAQALLKLGHDGAGLALLWRLWERRPGFGPAAQLLAFAHLEHDPELALKALSRTPRAAFGADPRFLALEAQALIALGRTDEAEAALEDAVGLARDPDLILCRANARSDVASKAGQLNLVFATRLLATVEADGETLAFHRIRAAPGAPRSGPPASAIVTTFNCAAVVAVSVRSLLDQTYDAVEIIVVDDASTDGTVEAVEALARPGRTLKVVRQSANRGTYAARNAGIAEARGAFVLFQDSDDWAHPQKIARGVALLEKTGAMASTACWARLDEHGRFVMKNPGAYVYRNASTLIRRTALDEVGAFQNVRVSADSEHYHRLLNRFGANAVLNDPAVLTLGRAWSGSLTGGGPATLSRLGASLPRAAYNGRWIDAQIAGGQGRRDWAALAAAPLGDGIDGVAPDRGARREPMTVAGLFALDELGRLKAFAREPRRLVERTAALQARLLASEAA